MNAIDGQAAGQLDAAAERRRSAVERKVTAFANRHGFAAPDGLNANAALGGDAAGSRIGKIDAWLRSSRLTLPSACGKCFRFPRAAGVLRGASGRPIRAVGLSVKAMKMVYTLGIDRQVTEEPTTCAKIPVIS